MVATQGMADDDRIIPGRIELTVRLVAERESWNDLSALERERLVVDEITSRDDADIARREVAARGIGRGQEFDVVRHWSKNPTISQRGRQGADRVMTRSFLLAREFG